MCIQRLQRHRWLGRKNYILINFAPLTRKPNRQTVDFAQKPTAQKYFVRIQHTHTHTHIHPPPPHTHTARRHVMHFTCGKVFPPTYSLIHHGFALLLPCIRAPNFNFSVRAGYARLSRRTAAHAYFFVWWQLAIAHAHIHAHGEPQVRYILPARVQRR